MAMQKTLPSEVDGDGRSLKRRIKMHEFLMTGGLPNGYVAGKMTYSEPITVVAHEVCPFHEDRDCDAWNEIRDGRGEWTRMEAELAGLIETRQAQAREPGVEVEDEHEALDLQIDELTEKLAARPRDAKALRERTPEQIAEERAATRPKFVPKKPVSGNPWDKPKVGGTAWRDGTDLREPDRWSSRPMYEAPEPKLSEPDSRDVAIEAFGAASASDIIEIDGDEGEEGEEA